MTHTAKSLPPESAETEPAAAELIRLAKLVDAWREGRGLSQNQLCRQIVGLNSKTHGLILREDLTELRPENHIPKYRAAVMEIEAFDLRQEAEVILPGLTPTQRITGAIASLKLNRGNDRFVLVEGESGAGKTSGLRFAAAADPDAVFISAHEGWASPCFALTELLGALGSRGKMPTGFAALQSEIKSRLQQKPRLLIVDEGHHLEYRLLNVIKDLINSTGCWVVVGTMASLWRKIQTSKWSEVKQLLHNRMHLRLTLPAPDATDVESFLTERLGLKVPTEKTEAAARWDRAFAAVASSARTHGLYAFCRKVGSASRLLAMKDKEGQEITPDHLFTAAGMVCANTEGFDR